MSNFKLSLVAIVCSAVLAGCSSGGGGSAVSGSTTPTTPQSTGTFNATQVLATKVAATETLKRGTILDIFNDAVASVAEQAPEYASVNEVAVKKSYQLSEELKAEYKKLTENVDGLTDEAKVDAYVATLRAKLEQKANALAKAYNDEISGLLAEARKPKTQPNTGRLEETSISEAKKIIDRLIEADSDFAEGKLNQDTVGDALIEIYDGADIKAQPKAKEELAKLTKEYKDLYLTLTSNDKVKDLKTEADVKTYLDGVKKQLEAKAKELKQQLTQTVKELNKQADEANKAALGGGANNNATNNSSSATNESIVDRSEVKALETNNFSTTLATLFTGKEVYQASTMTIKKSYDEAQAIAIDQEPSALNKSWENREKGEMNEFLLQGSDQYPAVKIKLTKDALSSANNYHKALEEKDQIGDGATGWIAGNTATGGYGEPLKNVRYGVASLEGITSLFIVGEPTSRALSDIDRVTGATFKGHAFYGNAKESISKYTAAPNTLTAVLAKDLSHIDITIDDTTNGKKFEFGGNITGSTFAGVKNNIETKGGFFGSGADDMAGIFHVIEGTDKGINGVFGGSQHLEQK